MLVFIANLAFILKESHRVRHICVLTVETSKFCMQSLFILDKLRWIHVLLVDRIGALALIPVNCHKNKRANDYL